MTEKFKGSGCPASLGCPKGGEADGNPQREEGQKDCKTEAEGDTEEAQAVA